MNFGNFTYQAETLPWGSVEVVVKADLIHQFWCRGVGPQTEAEIVEANRYAIDALVLDKLRAGSGHGRVEVTAADWETDGDETRSV